MIGNNMSLSTFFDGNASALGVFYPIHCVAAVFPNLEVAERAADRLLLAGFSRADVVSASGSEVLEFDRDMITVGHLLMRALSRFFTTSQSFSDHDLEDARRGAGFLVVRCPDDKAKQAAWAILESEAPWDARYYGRGGIEHLAGDPDTD
jgi:hypothetical protein